MWNKFELFSSPKEWSTKARRLFILTIPISGPLWMFCMGWALILLLCLIIISFPLLWVLEMWNDQER